MNFEPPFTMIICGNSGRGKTQILKELMNTKFKKILILFFCFMSFYGFSNDYDEFKEKET